MQYLPHYTGQSSTVGCVLVGCEDNEDAVVSAAHQQAEKCRISVMGAMRGSGLDT
jgi:hypothetical protein